MAYPLRNLNINWDFSSNSKYSLFNEKIEVDGSYCISFCDEMLAFYEICPISNSNIYIQEAFDKKTFFLDNVSKPFIYIKNIGDYSLNLYSSNQETGNLFFEYEEEKINKKFSCSFINYKIAPKESLILTLNVDKNGTSYFSSGEYLFGYFYNFLNIENENPYGLYPVCCVGAYTPIYRYNDLKNFNIDYIDCGKNNFNIYENGTKRVYDAPSESGDCLSLFIDNGQFIAIPNEISGCDCFNISSGNFNFQTWFKLISCSTGIENNIVASINSDPNFSLFGFNKECIFFGSGDVVNKELCFCTDSICFNVGGPAFCGGIRNDEASEKYTLNANDFTIDFFVKVNSLNISSFFDFNGIKLHLSDYSNCTFEIGSSSYNWQPASYIKTGQWQHFAVSRCSDCVRIYADSCCVFGACNTGICSGYCKALIGYRDGYCTLNACMYGFRFIKNQSLYTGNCIQRILPPLSSSGFEKNNQQITGDIQFLGLQTGGLDPEWSDRSISYANGFSYTELICEVIESGFFVKTGLTLNEWNHFLLDVNNCNASIWINGNLECVFLGFENSGICMPTSGGCALIIGGSSNEYNKFQGLLSYTQYINTNLTNPFIGTGFVPNTCGFNNCTNISDLSLDFKWTCPPTDSYKEYVTNSLIESNLDLNLSFSGSEKIIETGFLLNSKFGENIYESFIKINCVSLYCNDDFLCFIYPSEQNFYSGFFKEKISGDINLCMLYDIDVCSSKKYKYKYIYSGSLGDSNQNLIMKNLSGECSFVEFSGSSLIEPNCEYVFSGNLGDSFYVNFNLSCEISISDLINKDINRCNMFLPPYELFSYDYCYSLADLNFSFCTGVSGDFVNCCFVFETGYFLNCSKLISCLNQEYLNNASECYDLCLNYSENKFCTNSILCKNNCDISEPFVPIIASFQKSYFYSGLEYKYFPICCVIYKDLIYEIPESEINITLFNSGNYTNLNFPVQALSIDKLKIISNSEIYENLQNVDLNLNYSGINFNFKKQNLNCACFLIPKLNNCFISGLESPNVCLTLCSETKINDCVVLYLDPYASFNSDKFYGLNNLLFFIGNELNNGSIHQCNYSGFSYDSADYNFLMIDLENEFYNCCYKIPSGSGIFVIDQKISNRTTCFCEPFPYKLRSGDGYAYVMPIINCFQFLDYFIHCESGALCSEKNLCNNLNFLTTGFKYIGGATGLTSGNETGFLENSNMSYIENKICINIDSESINQTITGRCLSFSKNYIFSGIQPIKFITNYPLLDIKEPIYKLNLKKYSEEVSDVPLNDFYYFVYDLQNFQEKSIKILSPDLTFIDSIYWNDSAGEKFIFSTENLNTNGKIQNNAANIQYKIASMINSNPYYLCFSEKNNVCVNIVGNIL